MALSQRSRSVLDQGLSDLIDEEAVGEMLSYVPARDTEEPATKAHIDARFVELEARMAAMELRIMSALHEQMATFNAQMRTLVQWTLAAVVALVGLVVAMGFLQAP